MVKLDTRRARARLSGYQDPFSNVKSCSGMGMGFQVFF